MLKNRFFRIALLTVLLLLVPFIAMQFTDEVDWNLADFVIGGLLLLGVGVAFDTIIRKFPKAKHRIGLIGVLIALFLLLWAELAVGILGTPFSGS